MAKRDLSWLKPGVKVWMVEDWDWRMVSVFPAIVDKVCDGKVYFSENENVSGKFDVTDAYPTAAKAYRAAAEKCADRADSLQKQAVKMNQKADEYMRLAKKEQR